MLVQDFTLVDYRHFQFQRADSNLRVIFFSGITTGNETGSPLDVLGAFLDLFGIITSSLKASFRILLNKELFLVIIEALIFLGTSMKIWCCIQPHILEQG